MVQLKNNVFWLIAGSQNMYGQEILEQVKEHSMVMSETFNYASSIPCKVIFKAVLTTPDAVRKICSEADSDDKCCGLIILMHTFSPAKMWIGMGSLRKPFLHLHTQFNRDIPWESIDMNFMNLNQSAHGDREFGFIGARMSLQRKVIAGYWQDAEVHRRIGVWMRAAVGYIEGHRLKVARFGDNMREVAVTEGDKVEAQIQLGWSVSGYGIGDLVSFVKQVEDSEVNRLLEEYESDYEMVLSKCDAAAPLESIREQARIELGMKAFMEEGGFGAFTTTFEELHGMKQLPGLAVQRLMAEGYGFGGEGDWKTAAMVRISKLMASGLEKGTSFMEYYTYHFEPDNEMVLGSHMLEVCPTLAAAKPTIEVHPLSIGGKEEPARLVFNCKEGPAVCASLIDMGNRFRLIVNDVDAVKPVYSMPELPVARVLWKPQPSLCSAAEAWIYAGGSHHTVFSYDITSEHLLDWSEMAGMECLIINKDTSLNAFKKELKWNEAARGGRRNN